MGSNIIFVHLRIVLSAAVVYYDPRVINYNHKLFIRLGTGYPFKNFCVTITYSPKDGASIESIDDEDQALEVHDRV